MNVNGKHTTKVIIITAILFSFYFLIDKAYFADIRSWINQFLNAMPISHILAYLIVGIPLFLGVLMIHQRSDFFEALGIQNGIFQGFVVALICTIPMFLGYAIVFDLNAEISWRQFILGVVCAGFFEELFFRGFLFGQIFRYTKIGFIPAILIGALLFGSVHLYQSQDPATLIGIFMMTFAGAFLFAWSYVEWDNNLWVPIFLHMFMNFSWMLFSAGETALGDLYANIFRFATVGLVILGTVIYKRKRGVRLIVNKDTIWMQKC
jgi:membrane protease YdiL (CAAX protease family)